MPITIRDEATAAALAATTEPHDVLGPDGRLLGRFTPADQTMTYPEIGLTDAELHRRLNEPTGWVSADEVMARLRQLRDST
jgi:hypothetical protein